MKVSSILWFHILELKKNIANGSIQKAYIVYSEDKGFVAAENLSDRHKCIIFTKEHLLSNYSDRTIELLQGKLYLQAEEDLDNSFIQCIRLYIPLVFAPLITRKKPLIITHQAQSIDGKIATSCGSSQWIGNQANLVHAHRIRALVDGVLVGTGTILNDKPKLNVRYVEGKNPIRLFLTNSIRDFSDQPKVDDITTYLLRQETNNHERGDYAGFIHKTIYYEKHNYLDLCSDLYNNGIKSILIEGGSKTISSFLASEVVDLMQFHICPSLFGSGIPTVSLDNISRVNQSKQLKNVFYTQLDDAMMLTGELIKHNPLYEIQSQEAS